MSTQLPALFEYFPELADRLPWVHLQTSPSPVELLLGFDHDRLWIKRDDIISPVYGGNKVRKLEFALGEVIRQGKTDVITIGGIGSNHAVATAIYCRRLGLKCRVILYDQPLSEPVIDNLKLIGKYATEIVYAGGIFKTGLHYYLLQKLRYLRGYFLYSGGSSVIGTVGIVSAAFELRRQIEQGMCPEPHYIVCPLGSNGTVAGLALGLRLAGLSTEVVGIRVGRDRFGPIQLTNEITVQRLMAQTHALLSNYSHRLSHVSLQSPLIIHDYIGDGYGIATVAGQRAIDHFSSCSSIRLDPIYTAKTVAAIFDKMRESTWKNKNVLFWHTYNGIDFSNEIRSLSIRHFPRRLKIKL